MKCPGCGAAVSKKMVAEGECGYCHTLLAAASPAKPVEPPQPKVVHVTRVELPDLEAGRLFDSVTARITGCFTGCLSAGVSLAMTAMILAFVAWQLYASTRHLPSPAPAPAPVENPHPRKRR